MKRTHSLTSLHALLLCVACAAVFPARAGNTLLDHRIGFDESGIWSRPTQLALTYVSATAVIGGALIEGKDTRLGRTFWAASDAMVFTAAAAQAGKWVFRRQRPRNGNDPNAWFRSRDDQSFPSGEVAHITAVVTPFIAEYQSDYPAVWALAALPVYDAVARMKSQAHWQTDVLAGAALGAALGLYAHSRPTSWVASITPQGWSVGWRKQF